MDKIPNIDAYALIEKAVKKSISLYYETCKRGYIDFPNKQKWVNDEFKLFRQNNPELFKLKYDKQNEDFVFEYEGGLHRIIL